MEFSFSVYTVLEGTCRDLCRRPDYVLVLTKHRIVLILFTYRRCSYHVALGILMFRFLVLYLFSFTFLAYNLFFFHFLIVPFLLVSVGAHAAEDL